MRKIVDFYNKNKILIITLMLFIIFGILFSIVYFNIVKNNNIKEYKNYYYSLKYDNSWKIRKKDDKSILLNHGNDGTLNVNIISLDNENKYKDINSLIDTILFDISNQNSNYKLVAKEQANITSKEYKGYKILYELDNRQAMVTVFKKSDKLVLLTYEASDRMFDLLLDSVNNIIYNFDTVEQTFSISNKIDVSTSSIEWSDNNSPNISEEKSYDIAKNNYLVNYSIPGNFESTLYDTSYSNFNFKGLENGTISLSVNIYNSNIYDYINKDNGVLYSDYKLYREDNKSYSEYKESIDKNDNKEYLSFIYKNSYKSIDSSTLNENIKVIYELDKNHVIVFYVSSTNCNIYKNIIDKIKINSKKNYASNIKRNIVNNNLVGELKQYIGYTIDKTCYVTIKLPDKYNEIDNEYNMYKIRYYGLNYNPKNSLYDYTVKYNVMNSYELDKDTIKSILSIHSNSENFKDLTKTGDVTINNKTFNVYDGGYIDYSGTIMSSNKYYSNVKLLVYQDDDTILTIEIRGNGFEISNDIISQVTNFDIEKK